MAPAKKIRWGTLIDRNLQTEFNAWAKANNMSISDATEMALKLLIWATEEEGRVPGLEKTPRGPSADGKKFIL